MNENERRSTDRKKIVHILWFKDATACYYSGKIVDVSEFGFKISARFIPDQLENQEAEFTFKPGDKITISNNKLKMKCTLRWCDYDGDNCVFGVHFEEKLNVREMIDEYSNTNPHYLNIYS